MACVCAPCVRRVCALAACLRKCEVITAYLRVARTPDTDVGCSRWRDAEQVNMKGRMLALVPAFVLFFFLYDCRCREEDWEKKKKKKKRGAVGPRELPGGPVVAPACVWRSWAHVQVTHMTPQQSRNSTGVRWRRGGVPCAY